MTRRIWRQVWVYGVLAAVTLGGYACRSECCPPRQAAAPQPTGAALYQQYCASCHGTDGIGNGPLATALQKAPADLTRLAARNGGKFDEPAIIGIIDGRQQVQAHGPRDMPVWGAVFDEELKDDPYGSYTGLLRAKVLAEYLATLQQQ